jgi:hypothetical protein
LRIADDCIGYGPAVAAINYFTSSPTLIDPEFIWQFFSAFRKRIAAPVAWSGNRCGRRFGKNSPILAADRPDRPML